MSFHNVSYLRSSRRRTGLTQDDVAFLIGLRVASQVSRHESGEREPDLRLALGYKLVFDAALHDLLPKIYVDVARKVNGRAQARLEQLSLTGAGQRSRCRTEHLRSLIARVETITTPV